MRMRTSVSLLILFASFLVNGQDSGIPSQKPLIMIPLQEQPRILKALWSSRGNPQSSQILVPAKKGLDASTYGQGRHMVKSDAEKSNNLGIRLETKSSPNEIVWVEAKMSNAFEATERPPSAQEHLCRELLEERRPA